MRLQYRNRRNAIISISEWRRLIRSDTYCRIAYARINDKIAVDTSWIGVYAPGVEKRPAIFLTQVVAIAQGGLIAVAIENNGKSGKSLARDIWTGDEEEAIEAHFRRARELAG